MRCNSIAEGTEQFVQAYNADLVAFSVSKGAFWKNLLLSSTTSRLLEELNLPMRAFPQYPAAATGIISDEQEVEHMAAPEEPAKQ